MIHDWAFYRLGYVFIGYKPTFKGDYKYIIK